MRSRIYVKAQKWRYIVSSSTPVRISETYYCDFMGYWSKFEQLFTVHVWCSGNIMWLLLCRQDSFSDELAVNFYPRLRFSPPLPRQGAVAYAFTYCFARSLMADVRQCDLRTGGGKIQTGWKTFRETSFTTFSLIEILVVWRVYWWSVLVFSNI